MSHPVIFDRPNYSNSDSLLIALFVALVIHIILGLTVNFTTPEAKKIRRSSIDVTLVQAPSKKAPKKAKFLAPENQEGAGQKISKIKQPVQKPIPHPVEHKQPPEKPVKKIVPIKPEIPETPQQPAKKVIVKQKLDHTSPAVKPAVVPKTEPRPHLDEETLRQQITQLGSEIRYNAQDSDNNQAKTLAQVSAHKFVAAQYIKDWESKVERTGNMNYPEAAAKKPSSTLTMDVGIEADGSIHNIRIRRSSGNAALDEAAKNIVKMSAPFAPLPSALLKELKILVITRKWKFSDESGMTTP